MCVSLQPDSCNKYNDIVEEGVKQLKLQSRVLHVYSYNFSEGYKHTHVHTHIHII